MRTQGRGGGGRGRIAPQWPPTACRPAEISVGCPHDEQQRRGDMPDNMMRAARFHEYGPAENLVIEDVPRPEPQAGEVLVRVHAAGVNPVDWKIRRGYLKEFMPVPLPFTPGVDLAGIVTAVGPDIATVQPGQAAFG